MRSLVEGPMRKQRPAVYQSLLLEEEMGADPLVADIEERVARLSGIPAHADESPLRASLNRVWPPQRAVHSLRLATFRICTTTLQRVVSDEWPRR